MGRYSDPGSTLEAVVAAVDSVFVGSVVGRLGPESTTRGVGVVVVWWLR